jgi:hypothetical protein
LTETERVTITLTVDAGPADAAVLAQEGRLGVRQGRILRLSETSLPLSILDVSRPYVSPTGIAPERLKHGGLQRGDKAALLRQPNRNRARAIETPAYYLTIRSDFRGLDICVIWCYHVSRQTRSNH